MRAVGRLATTPVGTTTTKGLLISSSFSSSSSAGGRGRGRGFSPPFTPPAAPGKVGPTETDADAEDTFSPPGLGLGHGRGRPIPQTPVGNSFSPWISSPHASAGRGRSQPPVSSTQPTSKAPIFFRREDQDSESAPKLDFVQTPAESGLPRSMLPGLPGAGRGKTAKPPEPDSGAREENRHLRARPRPAGPARGGLQRGSPTAPPRLSRQEAVERAVGILRGGRGGTEEGGGRGRGGRTRGRGRGGRGMQPWRERGERGGVGRGRGHDTEEGDGGLYVGDNADGERLVQNLGEENMSKLNEAFEDMSSSVLPSPLDDAYLDALDMNYLIEFEPEYMMEEFGTNPDVDDKPPIPLRDALEKMKPFLMAYEGIQSQEEWEEIMKETMEKVPYMKQLIDMYAGPDRMTAKQEQEELERVAKTLPDDVPSSVKKFTDRALLTLQSNPGWGFDKKYQFMDKMIREVSQPFKW